MESINLYEVVISVFASVMASSGFWAWMNNRSTQNRAEKALLLGIAHVRIINLGWDYLDRGYITKDEYEDFVKYLYKPYVALGGNGLAEKIMIEVNKLPVRSKIE